MYEEQNIMTQSDYEPYLLSLYPTQTTTIIDTDYDSYAVIYNCGTLLAGFLVFDDYIVLSKNSVNYDLYSDSNVVALLTLLLSFPDLDENSIAGPYSIHSDCP